ncbi:D-alanyl-D-alanine carboxypeptidase/D-alanyl-D-alanine-endopeptidase [Pedobacter sp. ISL-68]|uniref:D-alanyl-D-alanine carboxypeptidase/D-alanyl-D-alanine endopeptidase n=1 Tax=unclassified Pedobacter TaxID=2628915 RepID=UPI001BEC2B37|nr:MULTISPECIES: D-alanyl-D-alanine carboxypeptidase/D-alanyl-D-alanine-endopeptidase [unclassified Pedobacter]MBT2563443.1 D-alanyl-D-alanine carboxypeptidase/D-alanyl-D-alanine-endopeptidase [Pedobacter sp. ISL-64]MBT2592937.1 D-alanyl-D-alanine carboxypeptidase/D-alanyl-D-alanine-endopeptidase [Pedobacter sp. ISL-68]
MKFFKLLTLFVFSATATIAQNRIQNLEKAFNNLLNDEQAKHAIASLCVLDANTGKTLYAKNEQIGLATASTLKTITAATAFSILGKDFQFQTTLAYTGTITTDGTLKGNLIIIGSGDPTLGSWRYQNKENAVLTQWVAAIKSAGIKKIEGTVIGDDRIFGTQTTPEGWVWQDIGNYYGAGTSGLSWRENQFDIHLKPGSSTADEVKVGKTVPATPYVQIINELKTGSPGSGDRSYAFLPPYSNVAYLRGSWGVGIAKTGISVALPDPAFDCAYRLQDTLKRLGISTGQQATTARLMTLNNQVIPSLTQKISTISSPSLGEMTYWFLKKSINLYGESFLKTIAIKSGKAGTTSKGAETEINFWADKGIDKTALNIIDGSGLSPGDRITTSAMADILFQIQKENWFGDYYNALPEYNGMKIKSGTINDVSAFAGYHTDAAGNKYVIVININNYSGSGINKKLFKVLDELK